MNAQHLTELQAQRAVNESVTCNTIVKAVGLYHGYIVLNTWQKQQAELGASYNVWQNGQAVGLYHGYIARNTWHKQQAETGDSEFVTCERIVRLLYCIRGTSYSTPGTSSKHRKERVGL